MDGCESKGMINLEGGKIAPFSRGVVLKNDDGSVLGSVGVSGAASDENEYCALRGVQESYYLKTEPMKSGCKTIKDNFSKGDPFLAKMKPKPPKRSLSLKMGNKTSKMRKMSTTGKAVEKVV